MLPNRRAHAPFPPKSVLNGLFFVMGMVLQAVVVVLVVPGLP